MSYSVLNDLTEAMKALDGKNIKDGLVYLLEPEWKETSIMKSYTTGQGVGLKSDKRRRFHG